MRMIPNYAVC